MSANKWMFLFVTVCYINSTEKFGKVFYRQDVHTLGDQVFLAALDTRTFATYFDGSSNVNVQMVSYNHCRGANVSGTSPLPLLSLCRLFFISSLTKPATARHSQNSTYYELGMR